VTDRIPTGNPLGVLREPAGANRTGMDRQVSSRTIILDEVLVGRTGHSTNRPAFRGPTGSSAGPVVTHWL